MNFLRKVGLAVTGFLMALAPVNAAFAALTESQLNFYAQNNILFYDPGNNCLISANDSLSSGETTISGSGYDRLKDAVRKYGEFAMQMQRKWGTPWEVVFAQMQIESSVGTAGIAVSGADNNWLGITGSGDAGYWTSSSGRKWAKFSSIEASIEAWAGTKVLRSGIYDDAFQYLDPDDWNLNAFLRTMISHYAPNSDGNDEVGYVGRILGLINGPIAEVRAEMGWPSSEDYARMNNIHAEGEYSAGSETDGDLSALSDNQTCYDEGVFSGVGGARLAEIAIWMAWPDSDHWNVIKEGYRQGLISTGRSTDLSYAQDCSHFVATVVLYSGLDDGFPYGGSSSQESHMRSSSLWTQVDNTGNVADLMPGDILVNSGHIMMYVGGDGAHNLAQASIGGGRVAKKTGYLDSLSVVYGRGSYFGDPGGASYNIYRYVGSDEGTQTVQE